VPFGLRDLPVGDPNTPASLWLSRNDADKACRVRDGAPHSLSWLHFPACSWCRLVTTPFSRGSWQICVSVSGFPGASATQECDSPLDTLLQPQVGTYKWCFCFRGRSVVSDSGVFWRCGRSSDLWLCGRSSDFWRCGRSSDFWLCSTAASSGHISFCCFCFRGRSS